MEKTFIICDRCSAQDAEGSENFRKVQVLGQQGRVRASYDLCMECVHVLTDMKWGVTGLTPTQHEEFNAAVFERGQLERDRRYALSRVADAQSAWRNGNDDEAQRLLREATARLGGES